MIVSAIDREAQLVGFGALLVVLAVLAVWLIPKRQARRWAARGIADKELAELENGARTTIVQIVGGVALILTFLATWTQISDTRKATNKTLRLNESQQEIDRFTRAVEQLGSNNFALRLGGIYSLEQVARASPEERDPVVQLMVAYLRQNHAYAPHKHKPFYGGGCFSAQNRPKTDTQAALEIALRLRRPPSKHKGGLRLNLSSLNLRAVRIRRQDLSQVDLTGSFLVYANAADAHFDHAFLVKANLVGACLKRASFHGASFDEANVTGADFTGAKGVNLGGARGRQYAIGVASH